MRPQGLRRLSLPKRVLPVRPSRLLSQQIPNIPITSDCEEPGPESVCQEQTSFEEPECHLPVDGLSPHPEFLHSCIARWY